MTLPPSQDRVEHVSPKSIREKFNGSQYPDMIADGRLIADQPYLRDAHLEKPEIRNEPYCTRGQMIRYRDKNGRWVVEVFRYVRPDGTIGGSGRPDPKRLRIGNTVFYVV